MDSEGLEENAAEAFNLRLFGRSTYRSGVRLKLGKKNHDSDQVSSLVLLNIKACHVPHLYDYVRLSMMKLQNQLQVCPFSPIQEEKMQKVAYIFESIILFQIIYIFLKFSIEASLQPFCGSLRNVGTLHLHVLPDFSSHRPSLPLFCSSVGHFSLIIFLSLLSCFPPSLLFSSPFSTTLLIYSLILPQHQRRLVCFQRGRHVRWRDFSCGASGCAVC